MTRAPGVALALLVGLPPSAGPALASPARTPPAQDAFPADQAGDEAWRIEVLVCRAALGWARDRLDWDSATQAPDWWQRARGFEALARWVWIAGPDAAERALVRGVPAAEGLEQRLRAGRRDPHPSVRAAAWRASWAADAALGEAELIEARSEPLLEARSAAAALCGPERTPSPRAAAALCADGEARVRRWAQAALLAWSAQDPSAAAQWFESAGRGIEAPGADLDEWLAGIEQLERQGDPRAAAAVESAMRAAGAPDWARLAPALLAAAERSRADGAPWQAAAWPRARARSARLGALLSRLTPRVGPELGRALLETASAAGDTGALDDALAALGPAAPELAVGLDDAALQRFLERARFVPLRWSEPEARAAWQRLGTARGLVLECLETALEPLPEGFLLEVAERAPLDLAWTAFACLARRAPQLEDSLAALCARCAPERALRFERGLPLDRPWPAFAPRWLEAGGRDPARRAELAPRLARCGGAPAAQALGQWIEDSRRRAPPDPGLGALLEAFEALDPQAAQAQRSRWFAEFAPQGGPWVAGLARKLVGDSAGRAQVLVWLSSAAPRELRSERELWILLLARAGPLEFAVRQAAIARLAEQALCLPVGRAEGALRALAGAAEPEAAAALRQVAADAVPARRLAVARALREGSAGLAEELLGQLAADPDLGVRREALETAIARGDAWPLLLGWRLAWPAPAPEPPTAPLQALAELRFEIELAAVSRGLLPAAVLDPILAQALELAQGEFGQPLDWPAPARVRYEALLRALAALAAAPGRAEVGLAARLAGLPSDALQAASAAVAASDAELAYELRVLALAAGLGATGGPDPTLADLALEFAVQSPGPRSQRLLSLCLSAP